MRYTCHDCGDRHSTENVVAFCANCRHKIMERYALEMSKKDAEIAALKKEVRRR